MKIYEYIIIDSILSQLFELLLEK